MVWGVIASVALSMYGNAKSRSSRNKQRRTNDIYATKYEQAQELAAMYGEKAGMMDYLTAQSQGQLIEAGAYINSTEIIIDSARVAKENDRFVKNQQLAFIKSGVDSAGTPLMVMNETMKEGDREVQALERQAENIQKFGMIEAQQTVLAGRAKMVASKISAQTQREAASAEAFRIRNSV